MSLVLTTEPMTRELLDEMHPLGQQCWDECTVIKGGDCAGNPDRGVKIIVDDAQYLRFADLGRLFVITLRDAGALCGFVTVLTYTSPHHSAVLCGNVDVFYVVPAHRAYARSMIWRVEAELRKRNVAMIGWPVSPKASLYQLLQRCGFVVDDVMLEKRLCVQSPQGH